jgi:prohibitin 1
MRLLLITSILFYTGCSVVGPGERGVRISLGTASDDPKPPGAYLWIPFLLGMEKLDIQIQKSDIKSTAASKDMQDVHAEVAINWSLAEENVVRTYKEIGSEWYVENRILVPAVNEVMKAATAKRTAEEVLTHRLEMKKDIDDGLIQRLKQYGITLHDVSIVNLKFSEGFTHAIEEKQIAEQQAQQASYIAQKATQEAKAEVERAKGQAEAQRLVQTSTTAAILQQRAIEKWDGHFPTYMGGTLPFVSFKGN